MHSHETCVRSKCFRSLGELQDYHGIEIEIQSADLGSVATADLWPSRHCILEALFSEATTQLHLRRETEHGVCLCACVFL